MVLFRLLGEFDIRRLIIYFIEETIKLIKIQIQFLDETLKIKNNYKMVSVL